MTMSLISDELGQATTKKKEFLGIMEKLIPWSQWVGIVQPHYYKGERGNKPYDLGLMLRIYVLQHLYNLADDAARNEIIDRDRKSTRLNSSHSTSSRMPSSA